MLSKKIWLSLAAIVVTILLVGVYLLGQQNKKPEQILETLNQAVATNDPGLLEGLIMVDKKQASINQTSIKAMLTYLKQNTDSYKAIQSEIKQQIDNQDYMPTGQQISLVEGEKQWGFFPTYHLLVKAVYIKPVGLQAKEKLVVSINKPLKQKEGLYGPLLPGVYQVKTTLTNDLSTFSKKEKIDIWGSKEVSLIINSVQLVQKDKEVKKQIMQGVDIFNRDLAVFQTSGFDVEKLTNITDDIKNDPLINREKLLFEQTKDYIAEIHASYLGTTINMGNFEVNQFDGKWSAQVEALVAYNSKVKLKESTNFEEQTTKTIAEYSLTYEPKLQKWLINGFRSRETDGKEVQSWEDATEMKVANPQILKWPPNSQGEVF